LFIYIIEVAGGALITDVGVLFNVSGAVASSALTFIFPALFYLLAEKKFASVTAYECNKWIRRSA
jgi:hypothetical protein